MRTRCPIRRVDADDLPMRKLIVCMVIVLLLRSAGAAWAAPSTPDCAEPGYRQTHLQECNAKHDPWSRYPPGGGGPRGLLGLGGIGGIL